MAANPEMPLKGDPTERARLRLIRRRLAKLRQRLAEADSDQEVSRINRRINKFLEEQQDLMKRIRLATDGMSPAEVDAIGDEESLEQLQTGQIDLGQDKGAIAPGLVEEPEDLEEDDGGLFMARVRPLNERRLRRWLSGGGA